MSYRATLVVVSALAVLLPAVPARATDNVTPVHQHNRTHSYRINSSFPADWKPAVREAGQAWTARARLRFEYAGETSSTNPYTTTKIVWRGSIPRDWQGACPPSTTLACTRVLRNSSNHITDADMVYNSSMPMGTSSFLCALSIGIDVQTLGVHEFGHFGFLDHSSDEDAVMYASYQGCQRLPQTHDINSMNRQYTGH